MADVTVKTIETRLQLKYDTYANWHDDTKPDIGANLVLLPGELGICAIGDTTETGNAQATTNPTVLFKVGDGVTPFKTLKWSSALAADVYAWAKADAVAFNSTNKTVEFKKGDTLVHSVDLSYFAAASDVADHDTRLDDIEAALGLESGTEGTDSISAKIAGILERLNAIQGGDDVEGSIAKAKKEAVEAANAYTDGVVGNKAEGDTAATGLRKEIADAQAAAESYADGKVSGLKSTLEAKDSELSGEITRVEGLVTAEATNRDNADKAINEKLGEGFDATNTVAAKVKAAQDAADAAQEAVDALTATGGDVAKNTADIAQLTSDLATETSERKAADEALDNRLKEVEAFFEGAARDGEGLDNALDKLVEIQEYLDGDGSAADGLVGQVSANAQAIEDLQNTLAKDGDFEKRVAAVEAKAGANESAIESLQALTAGEFGEGTIKDAIDAAAAKGQQGIDDAATAKAAADAAQKDVDDLAIIVGKEAVGTAGQEGYEEATGLVKVINDVNTTATDAQARVAAVEPRIEQAEKDIDALEAIVKTGENTNAQLRADIEALEAIVVDGEDGNVKLGAEIDAIAAKVNNEETGLAATKKIADDNAADIAEIKADYLKSTDAFIFNCGSSTTVTHTVPATPAE